MMWLFWLVLGGIVLGVGYLFKVITHYHKDEPWLITVTAHWKRLNRYRSFRLVVFILGVCLVLGYIALALWITELASDRQQELEKLK